MNCKSFWAVAASLLIGFSASAQEAQQVTVGDNMNFGITYSLPKTVVRATIEASCTKKVAGPYAAYAEKFLGLKDVTLEDQTEWEVMKISLENYAQADASRTYHIDFNPKGALPTFYFTEDRCLWSVNQQPASSPKEAVSEEEQIVSTGKPIVKASDVLTSEILKAGSKVKQAELIAQEIFSIRESRSLLIKGEADNMPGDGASLQLMLDNLTAQEEALLSLFVGTTSVSQKSHTVDYLPLEDVERELLFRFSKFLGFVDIDDLAGEPYYISVKVTEDNRMAELDEKSKKKADKGLAFCIPGKAKISLLSVDGALASGEMYMGQFGHVEQLPVTMFTDKKKPVSALFNPMTGAVRFFENTAQ